MMPRQSIRSVAVGCCLVAFLSPPISAEESHSDSFRGVLELAGLGAEVLAELGAGPNFSDEDWQTLLRVFGRLEQFRDLQSSDPRAATIPSSWLEQPESSIGELFEIEGQIVSVEKLPLPKKWTTTSGIDVVYRCQFSFLKSLESPPADTTVLTTRIPKSWQTLENISGRVSLRGALIQMRQENSVWRPLVLTNHIAWYPVDGVPTGQLLLARNGMDIALLDEVRHRKPFVKPEISRESEAFYAALKALGKSDPQDLAKLAKQNVVEVAERWRQHEPDLRRKHEELKAELKAVADGAAREVLVDQIKRAKSQRGLAAAVVAKADDGQSSVAPMFLQPEVEVGELFVLEGIARRAVRIAVEHQSGKLSEIEAYYELEVFTSDSRNMPIVCCVLHLPARFPQGDEIREPVQLAGVFFKSWRYRSRALEGPAGETGRQRKLYNIPVVLGNMPTWLATTTNRSSHWAIWGGIAFLGILGTLWLGLAWLARRDRQARATLRRTETIDL